LQKYMRTVLLYNSV